MVALALEWSRDVAERRPADERPAHRREAAPRGLPAAVGVAQLWAGDAAAWPLGGEIAQDPDRVRRRLGVGVRDDDELAARLGDAPVDVRAEAARPSVFDEAGVRRQLDVERQVCHYDQLPDLRCEAGEAALQIITRLVRDDDAGDAHMSSRYTASVRLAVSLQL